MTPEGKHAVLRFCALGLIFAGAAALSLAMLPKPHKPLHYLIAGTVATGASLVVVAFALWRSKSPAG